MSFPRFSHVTHQPQNNYSTGELINLFFVLILIFFKFNHADFTISPNIKAIIEKSKT